MAAVYFNGSFAGQAILIRELSTERGRDIVVQSPAQGDIHTLSDQGKRVWKTTYEVLFAQQPGRKEYLERYEDFVRACEDGDPHELIDPVDGSFTVRAENLTSTHDDGLLQVRVTVTFFEEKNAPAVFPVAAGVDVSAGIESLTTAAERMQAVLDEFELETPDVIPEALEEVSRWADLSALGEIDSQEVFLGVSSITSKIDEAIADLELKRNNTLWPVYREAILLRYEVVRVGEALTSDEASLLEIFVATPRPVIAICAEIYGGSFARERAAQVTKINRIRTPGRVPAGTTLKMPAIGAT